MTLETIEGPVWVVGDNIDTDQIAPGQSLVGDWDTRKAAMLPLNRDLVEQFTKGDIIVGGRNFGCGSSREQAVENLILLGVSCIVAESFSRIFLRNAIANALPLITVPDITKHCRTGDVLRFDWDTFEVQIKGNDARFSSPKYSPEMLKIIESGGMLKMLQSMAEASQ